MGIQGTPNMGMVIFAAIIISLALVFYTIGVFAERRSGTLRPKHLAFFWTGFVLDTAGTTIMSMVAGETGGAGSPLHAITGVLALSLMLFHAVWATVVVLRGNERSRANFHRLSIGVWLFWLVPYGVGVMLGAPMFPFSDSTALTITASFVLVLGIFFCLKANKTRLHRYRATLPRRRLLVSWRPSFCFTTAAKPKHFEEYEAVYAFPSRTCPCKKARNQESPFRPTKKLPFLHTHGAIRLAFRRRPQQWKQCK